MGFRGLSLKQEIILGLAAVAAFHLAYEFEVLGGVVVVYLGCMFALAWAPTRRLAFYPGVLIGLLTVGPQLAFFWGIFGVAALVLWTILALWLGLYLLLARMVVERWRNGKNWGALWLPVLWLALEYFRSELYYLRFAWLTPGFVLGPPGWLGVYGISFVLLLALAILRVTPHRRRLLAVVIMLAALFGSFVMPRSQALPQGPYVAGLQSEDALSEDQIIRALDKLIEKHPQTDIAVLSECTFAGPVPDGILTWCQTNQKYLVAGGRDHLKEREKERSRYYNTAFVAGPAGKIIFKQAKSVPIQFFDDGLPAREQRVWQSPWGKIGIAICYDLSYTRVMDELVRQGAAAFIIPAVDQRSWGRHQHELHAKVAPVRAREYGVGIFRLASSGISQLVWPNGQVAESAPFPGQGEMLGGVLPMRRNGKSGSLPLDRYLAPAAVLAIIALLIFLAFEKLRKTYLREGPESRIRKLLGLSSQKPE